MSFSTTVDIVFEKSSYLLSKTLNEHYPHRNHHYSGIYYIYGDGDTNSVYKVLTLNYNRDRYSTSGLVYQNSIGINTRSKVLSNNLSKEEFIAYIKSLVLYPNTESKILDLPYKNYSIIKLQDLMELK